MAEKDTGVKNDQEAPLDTDTGVETKVTDAPQEPDWKAIALKETEKAENYKKALLQKRQLRNVKPAEEVVEDDDKPLTRRDIREIIQDSVVPALAQNKEEQLLSSKISDPNKREAVRAILDSSIKRTGTSDQEILSDIDKALAIADSHKLRVVNAELVRKTENKPATTVTSGSSSEKEIDVTNLAPEIKMALEKRADLLKIPRDKFIAQYIENRKKTSVIR